MITINLVEKKGYSGTNLSKLNAAISMIPTVLNSVTFRDAVLNYKTGGKPGFSFKKNVLRDFEHYTNREVYDMIMQAREEPGNTADGIIDLYLELVPGGGGSTIGYGNPGSEWIYTYADWFENAPEKEIANHLVHEWCHKIGFDHAKYPWQDKNRDNSVPYGIGKLVEGFCGLAELK